MKFLFVHQNFPGQFLHILRHLGAQKAHELIFATESTRNNLNGVRRMVHTLSYKPPPDLPLYIGDLNLALHRAEIVARSARNLRTLGFTPDIIIGHQGWGEMLHLNDVWPETPVLGYQEFYYNTEGFDIGFDPEFPVDEEAFSRIRVKNAVNHMSLNNPAHGLTPTRFQLSTYPAWARHKIHLLEEGVNLDVCKPDPEIFERQVTVAGYRIEPEDKLVTYVVRDLEPYRGFHVFMRALPRLLEARPDVRVMLVGGDNVSYGARPATGTWRQQMLNELDGKIDLSRVHFAGRVPYDTFVKVLQRSDAHVYLTYPFVLSWSLREAMATGCAIVASDTEPVREFIVHGRTGVLVPFLEPEKIADGVLEMLENGPLARRVRRFARAWAEKHLDMKVYLRNYDSLIEKVIGAN